jgi:thiol-disulfide isomerase/thioredoxin
MLQKSFSTSLLSALLVSFAAPAWAAETLSTESTDLKDKPLVMLIFDQTCKVWCKQVRPIMKELQDEYRDRVGFAELDATESVLTDSKKKAKELGIGGYFSDAADYVPVVLIFTANRKLVKELPGPKTRKDYENVIDKAMGK